MFRRSELWPESCRERVDTIIEVLEIGANAGDLRTQFRAKLGDLTTKAASPPRISARSRSSSLMNLRLMNP